MTTFNMKSTVITNRDATPKVLMDPMMEGGGVKECIGSITTYGSADGAGSLYRLCQVPSNARMSSLVLQADALGSGAALDVGVFWPSFIPVGAGLSVSNQSTAINTTLFASGLGCSAATAATEVLNQSTNNTIVKQEKALWDAAGLSSDPGIDLDIVVRVSVAIAAQGVIGLKAKYVF